MFNSIANGPAHPLHQIRSPFRLNGGAVAICELSSDRHESPPAHCRRERDELSQSPDAWGVQPIMSDSAPFWME